MATHKEQDERVVLLRFIFRAGRGRQLVELQSRVRFPASAGQFAALVIEHAPARHLNQPGPGIVGKSFVRPLHGGRNQCS